MPKVLIVDDDAPLNIMLCRMLERAGYETASAANGLEAVNIYRQDQVDLIVTDIFMPEQEGIATILELRHDFPDVKIIAMSGGGNTGMKDYLNMAKFLGAQGIIDKPFTNAELLQMIEQLLAD